MEGFNIAKREESRVAEKSPDVHAGALERREEFQDALRRASSIEEIEAALNEFSYTDALGEQSAPVFMQDDTEFGTSVANKDGWIVDADIPLSETVGALDEYKAGHLSEQQLYHALGLQYPVIAAMERITGVPQSGEIQHNIRNGDTPRSGGEGQTIEGEIGSAQISHG